jgi:hypothetical protein
MHKHSGRKWAFCLLTLLFLARSEAVVFFSTSDPEFNTVAPGGSLTNSGWQIQGLWDLFLGTPVSSNYFISAKHVGGTMDWNFFLHGSSYRPVARFDHPSADLTLWKVSGLFTNFARLYTSSNEVGRPLVVFGRGLRRGNEIRLANELRGWAWGEADFRLRWGENTVAAITDRRGQPITSTNRAQCLRATFDAGAGTNEAHLSAGDSGGGVFIKEDGIWKLAGINLSVDGRYNTNTVGKGFDATLFDQRGFYRGNEDRWQLQSGEAVQPGGFQATRISAYAGWIQNVVTYGNPKGEMIVEQSRFPGGPFTPVSGAQIDGQTQTVRIALPFSSRFYRLRAMEPARIASITNSTEALVLRFE